MRLPLRYGSFWAGGEAKPAAEPRRKPECVASQKALPLVGIYGWNEGSGGALAPSRPGRE
jgi:hypothetical protein